MPTSIIAPRLVATSLIALGTALASGANAQTVIERTIMQEPVETTVTRTPTGTVITRRPLGAAAETAPDTIDAITTREVVRRAEATRAISATRRMATRQVSAKQVSAKQVPTRKVTTRTDLRATTQRRVVLTPAERRIVYQTIVEQNVQPAPRMVLEDEDVAPQTPYVVPPPLVSAQVALSRPPIVTRQEVIRPAAPAYRVGTVLPANTPLYAVPQDVALRVPAVQTYSYAYLGGRAYLVDPATRVIVEEVTE